MCDNPRAYRYLCRALQEEEEEEEVEQYNGAFCRIAIL